MSVQLIDGIPFTTVSTTSSSGTVVKVAKYELKADSIKDKSEKEIIMMCVYCILQNNETLLPPPYTLFNKHNLLNALMIVQTTNSDGTRLILQTKPEFEIFILQFKDFIGSYNKKALTYLATSEETFFEVEKVIGTKYSVDKITFKRPYYVGGINETTGKYNPEDYRTQVLYNSDVIIREVFHSTKEIDSAENTIIFDL